MDCIWPVYGCIWVVCSVCVLYSAIWTVYALYIDCGACASGTAFRFPAWAVYPSARGFRVGCLCTIHGCIWTVRTVDGSACSYMDCIHTVSRLYAASKFSCGLYSLCVKSMCALCGFIGAVWAVCGLFYIHMDCARPICWLRGGSEFRFVYALWILS